MGYNNINAFETFKTLNEHIFDKCYYKGSLVLYAALLREGINPERYVKDVDVTASIYTNSGNLVNNILILLREKYNENIKRREKLTGVNTIYFSGNHKKFPTMERTIIDIMKPKNIEYTKYHLKNESFYGSSVCQMISDKINSCSTSNYYRIVKDLDDLEILVNNFEVNLLDVLDCINFSGYLINSFEYLGSNVNNFIKNNKIDRNINFHKCDLYNNFVQNMIKARQLYNQFGIKYDKNKIIQREYEPIYSRVNISVPDYQVFNFNGKIMDENLLAEWT